MSVSHDSSSDTFTLKGTTSFMIAGESVSADFNPGVVVRGGVIEEFNLTLTSDIKVGGLSFSTDDLDVSYSQSGSTVTEMG